MFTLQLQNGKSTVVDEDVYRKFVNTPLFVTEHGYVVHNCGCRHSRQIQYRDYLHRMILGCPANRQVDHINGDRLDNRRSNLRIVTSLDNNKNHSLNKRNTSGYNGVYYDKRSGKWVAQASINNKTTYLGKFATKEDAINCRKAFDLENDFTIRLPATL